MKRYTFISMLILSSLVANTIDITTLEDARRTTVNSNEIFSYHDLIKDVKKSVVNISTTSSVKGGNFATNDFFDDPFFKDFFGFNFRFPEQEDKKYSSLGSGVIISKDGYIVTNNHVVEDADEIFVNLPGYDEDFKAKLIGTDPKTDIAVIKIDAKKDLDFAKFSDSSKILEGDIVFAIGNPFGVGSTITQGIVSALNKDNIGLNQYENFIQTDASINPGNSGGALVDSRGGLVGINSAILSRSGGNNGIGFAIPSNMVKDIAQKLISDGKIERGFIGVNISNLTQEQKELYNNKQGCLIINVQKDKPADKAGLKRGDLIIKIDDKDITSANDLKNLIGSMKPNSEVTATYERNKKIQTTKIKLDEMENIGFDSKIDSGVIDGLEIIELNQETKRYLRLDDSTNGIFIKNVKPGTKADKLGFRKRDVIIQVEQSEISNIEDFNKIMKKNKDKKVLIWVLRQGFPQGIVVK